MKKRKNVFTSILLSVLLILTTLGSVITTSAAPKAFNDVQNDGKYYYKPVYWAVENSVTSGTSATTFSPDAPCTRAQIVTFLWNAAGKPDEGTTNNFADVSSTAWYSKAVAWAVKNNITSGTSKTTFSPGAPCTRAQAVTFLWKANGSAEVSDAIAFTDVGASTWYRAAVAWAVKNNITGGVSATSFAPNRTCTRGQIVTFLYKTAGSPSVELPEKVKSFDYSLVPAYSGSPYVEINGNTPYFTASELRPDGHETYSNLDSLGRCGVADASVGKETMPTEKRGNIGNVKPTGWHTVKYAGIDGNYLYNRCHLLAYELTAENANEKNLITGTRYLNIKGMLPFENMIADYVKETGNHVEYRVTPIFVGSELLARGVLMEGQSVEDNGAGIKFCVFAYNVQPGVTIDYATGDSSGPEFKGSATPAPIPTATPTPTPTPKPSTPTGSTYYWTPSGKSYHTTSSCTALKRSKTILSGTLAQAKAAGKTDPCNLCAGG